MHSIQAKTTLFTVCAIVVTMIAATLAATIAIRSYGTDTSNQILFLLCETGEKNLDAYFESVEQSVETVSGYAEADLAETDLTHLDEHLDHVREIFEKTASNTAGILTYYYRIDPAVSSTSSGFWYVDLDGSGFQEHQVTDISQYDTENQTQLVWFTVPKATGSSIWLPPYVTDNLDVYVLSYNVPIYKDGRFVGVIGIEIDYNTLVEPVDNITLYENGYAFLNDAEGNIIYHPRMALAEVTGENKPQVPKGLLADGAYIRYSFEGVEKQAVWLPLSNGMRINVTVPISEINGKWHGLILECVVISAVLLVLFVLLALRFSGQITRPLRKLTAAAEQVNAGDYDVELDYDRDDEVGLLTRTFRKLIGHLKIYIRDLNNLAYSDALTSVHNKGAYDIYIQDMQVRLSSAEQPPEFAVGVFDCDNLKDINDLYGHEKGDIYLRNASALICGVFQHSPVFRTGGDEFSLILQNEDYRNRETLIRAFRERSQELCDEADFPWEQVNVSMGIADFDPQFESSVAEVARRADRLMYEDKRSRKTGRPNILSR